MRSTTRIAGVVLLFAGAFALGLGVSWPRATPDGVGNSGRHDVPPALVDQVKAALVKSYYRDLPASVLSRRSVRGIVASLDPYSEYLPPRAYEALRNRTARSYSGVGLTVRPGNGGLIVKGALEGPARDAGVRPGDRIVMIDGTRVRRLPFDRSLELIKGEEGTTVRLTVIRPHEGILVFRVTRSEIEVHAARSRLLLAGRRKLGYVRIASFRANAEEEVEQRASHLLRRGADGLVLDLRGNPGGLLSQAVATVSLFVEDGVVCVTEGDGRRRVYEVTGRAPFVDVPLVVLVDGGSASAAEIVAAALDDHERAAIVGRRTYGKAAVQSVRELSNGAALKLTTAIFLTPRGANLTARGIAPDIQAADRPGTRRDEALDRATAVLLHELAA
ncbi:MAG: S41 family peptidase [Actinomycetota bacterium]|nr:S41 family peptidase [Actinomycetota bacterium]